MQEILAPIDNNWLEFTDKRDPALREQLILRYAPLVKYVVGRMVVSLPGLLNNEDIISYGTVGLIQAVDRFDPALGVKFETYAIRRIRGSIIDAIRSLHPLSRDANRRARELEQAHDALTQRLGRAPNDSEMTEYLGLSLTDLHARQVEASASFVSLDTPFTDDGEAACLIDTIADESLPTVPDQAEQRELNRSLVSALSDLPERERLVISLYYYEGLTLKEISAVLSVSTSRVSQLHAAAILKLRAGLHVGRALAA